MEDTKKVTVALIQDDQERYLFIKRSLYKYLGKYQDAWYPPTGHLKGNEIQEEALVRELKEELNLDIKPIKLLTEWEQDIPGEKAYWWKCTIIGGEIKPNFEISDYKYFSKEEVKNIKIWPATKIFFERFIW